MGGEAKRRGTFEQRLAQALERKKQEEKKKQLELLSLLEKRNNQPKVAIIGHHRKALPLTFAAIAALSFIPIRKKQF